MSEDWADPRWEVAGLFLVTRTARVPSESFPVPRTARRAPARNLLPGMTAEQTSPTRLIAGLDDKDATRQAKGQNMGAQTVRGPPSPGNVRSRSPALSVGVQASHDPGPSRAMSATQRISAAAAAVSAMTVGALKRAAAVAAAAGAHGPRTCTSRAGTVMLDAGVLVEPGRLAAWSTSTSGCRSAI